MKSFAEFLDCCKDPQFRWDGLASGGVRCQNCSHPVTKEAITNYKKYTCDYLGIKTELSTEELIQIGKTHNY